MPEDKQTLSLEFQRLPWPCVPGLEFSRELCTLRQEPIRHFSARLVGKR